MRNSPLPTKTECRDFLANCLWFDTVPESALAELAKQIEWRDYAVGAELYRRGDAPTGVFGVYRGSFKVVTSNRDGQDAVSTVLGVDAWFGEICLCADRPYIADCLALQASRVMFIPAKALFSLCEQVPSVQRSLLTEISRKAMAGYGMSAHYKLASPEIRIAQRLEVARQSNLLEPSRNADEPVIAPGWVRLRESLSHELIAQMVGLSRPRVSVAMKTLEQAGVLKAARGRITIHVARLQAYCQQA